MKLIPKHKFGKKIIKNQNPGKTQWGFIEASRHEATSAPIAGRRMPVMRTQNGSDRGYGYGSMSGADSNEKGSRRLSSYNYNFDLKDGQLRGGGGNMSFTANDGTYGGYSSGPEGIIIRGTQGEIGRFGEAVGDSILEADYQPMPQEVFFRGYLKIN